MDWAVDAGGTVHLRIGPARRAISLGLRRIGLLGRIRDPDDLPAPGRSGHNRARDDREDVPGSHSPMLAYGSGLVCRAVVDTRRAEWRAVALGGHGR